MNCGKDKNICDMIDGLGKVVEDINSAKKSSKEANKIKKEIKAETGEVIKDVREELLELIKKVRQEKWVIGEYKWMPVGSTMPEGWVKVDIGQGQTLIQGKEAGKSTGNVKRHRHVLSNDETAAWGMRLHGWVYYTDRPVPTGGTIAGEQMVSLKDSKDQVIFMHNTEDTGGDNNLAAGSYAELWQFKGVDYVKKQLKKCLENSIEESINKCLEKK